MERQYTRLDAARTLIDNIIKNIGDEEDKRGAYVHLYGVELMASVLPFKRGQILDRNGSILAYSEKVYTVILDLLSDDQLT